MSKSTISLFRHLYKTLPPLFPEQTKEKMAHALDHLENDQTVTLDEIEDTMIKFGYEVWPWNQAYKEFLAVGEAMVGEHFLVPKFSQELKRKYHDFKLYGGTLRDIHSGRPAVFFTSDERGELCVALVEMQMELREYVNRELVGLEKVRYLRRVNEFQKILEEIERQMEALRALADKEQDHPNLANEIRARVRAFEYGLCLLGPDLNYEAVCQSADFFEGRKEHLDRLKGIHVPATVDFFA